MRPLAPAGVGNAVMNVSTGVNQSAGRSRPVAVKLPISADCLPTGTPPMLTSLTNFWKLQSSALPGASATEPNAGWRVSSTRNGDVSGTTRPAAVVSAAPLTR